MTDEEYYRSWAEDYSASARSTKEKIEKLKTKAKSAKSYELQKITYDIGVLTGAYYDCCETAKELMKKAERAKQKEA